MSPTSIAEQLWARARDAQIAGRHSDAVELYVQLTSLNPGSYAVQYNLGLSLQHLKRLHEATRAYQRALEIHPAFPEAHTNLANVLVQEAKHDLAIEHFRRALHLSPGMVTASMNLAGLLFDLGRYQEALESYTLVVKHDPGQEVAWSRLFSLAFALRQKKLAIGLYPLWAAQTPSLRQLAAGMVAARLAGDEALEHKVIETLQQFPFETYTAEDLYPILGNLPYFDVPGSLRLALYQKYASTFSAFAPEVIDERATDSKSKFRIGWVSADFRRHVMGRILLDLLRACNRERFEIHLFSTCATRFHDEITDQFRALARFHELSGLDDAAASKMIARERIDILVDFLGHTLGSKPGIFARRPARIQVSHLGYHGCPGMVQMNFKVTDHVADTPESVQFQLEKPLALDTCVMPFSSVDVSHDMPSRDAIRKLHGIGDRVAIGCFLNPIKLSPRCLRTWGRIAAAKPEAVWVFSLFDPEDEDIAASLMQKHGVRREQVLFLPPENDDAKLRARYRAIDLVLDTFPYAGGDTTIAALDMNVPVVTLQGIDHASRMGYSILWHLGLLEGAAKDEEEYIRKAVGLIEEPALRAARSALIESAKRNAPSARIENHMRSLERAFQSLICG